MSYLKSSLRIKIIIIQTLYPYLSPTSSFRLSVSLPQSLTIHLLLLTHIFDPYNYLPTSLSSPTLLSISHSLLPSFHQPTPPSSPFQPSNTYGLHHPHSSQALPPNLINTHHLRSLFLFTHLPLSLFLLESTQPNNQHTENLLNKC